MALSATAKTRLKQGGAALVLLAATTVGGYEGLRTVAYRDAVGIPTVCFGETRNVYMGDRYSVDECRVMLGDRLTEFSAGIDKCLKAPASIPDKTYVAFLSFAYNVGVGAFCGSTLVKRINSGDIRRGCDELLKWNRAGGRVLSGLTRRREEERALCLEGLKEAA